MFTWILFNFLCRNYFALVLCCSFLLTELPRSMFFFVGFPGFSFSILGRLRSSFFGSGFISFGQIQFSVPTRGFHSHATSADRATGSKCRARVFGHQFHFWLKRSCWARPCSHIRRPSAVPVLQSGSCSLIFHGPA
jgi:hypothetical protein